jgi:hypothetical protein
MSADRLACWICVSEWFPYDNPFKCFNQGRVRVTFGPTRCLSETPRLGLPAHQIWTSYRSKVLNRGPNRVSFGSTRCLPETPSLGPPAHQIWTSYRSKVLNRRPNRIPFGPTRCLPETPRLGPPNPTTGRCLYHRYKYNRILCPIFYMDVAILD